MGHYAGRWLRRRAGRGGAPGGGGGAWGGDAGRQIGAFLGAHHVMSLATLGAGGPHATNLFYAYDGLALLWVSDPDTQHSREIEADPRVAATVAPDYTDFAVIRGVQITGAARRIVAADERMPLQAQLEAGYAFIGQPW